MSTSTPLRDTEDADSGYHSNLSGICTSVDFSLPADRSKLFSYRTPDTADSLLDSVSATSFGHKERKNLGETLAGNCPRYIRTTLIEKEYVDFLHFLGERNNYTLIVKKILEYLSDEDLYSAANVSKIWKKIILSIPVQRKRYRIYARKLELTKENRVVNNEWNNVCEDKSALESRGMLTEIQNISRPLTSSNSPRSSASPVSVSRRFEAYQTEALRVKVGKRLFSCPKCKLPAHVDENELQTAICTNSNCLLPILRVMPMRSSSI